MRKKRIISLAALARSEDPFSDKDMLLRRLLVERPESRYLEWKLTAPVGDQVTLRAKYRMVKALISFANTYGGFIVFGVDPKGKWMGLSDSALSQADPASITELINSCVAPEIPVINYSEMEHKGLRFAVLHVPPSPLMPHVTVKEVFEQLPGGKRSLLVRKHAVYCRQGAKSDLATPSHFERIISRRTEFLRTELLRRVKEVPVPTPVSVKASADRSGTLLRVTRLTQDPAAPAVRLTRNPEEAAGVFLHEELSDGLFDEINNVVSANMLLAQKRQEFVLGPEIYYRIYAERQHVKGTGGEIELLAVTALLELYAPMLYWLLRLPEETSGRVIRALYENPRSPNVHALLRIAILLGEDVCRWLEEEWEAKWGKHSQPPDFYWTFQAMRRRKGVSDRRLAALRTTESAEMDLAGQVQKLRVEDLLKAPERAASLLSVSCLEVFKGNAEMRGACRRLDVLAYGLELEARASKIAPVLLHGLPGDPPLKSRDT